MWNGLLCSWIGRINTVKCPSHKKQSTDSIYSSKIPMHVFTEIKTCKCHIERLKIQDNQNYPEQQKTVGDSTMPGFKLY